jgi:hypothetical protein
VLSFFSSNEPWKTYINNGNFVLQQLQPGAVLQLSSNVSVTAAAVPHRAEFSDAVGYYIKVSLWCLAGALQFVHVGRFVCAMLLMKATTRSAAEEEDVILQEAKSIGRFGGGSCLFLPRFVEHRADANKPVIHASR